MKLLASSKKKNGKHMQTINLAITKIVLFFCNVVNNGYQKVLRVLFVFVYKKLFGPLIDISPQSFIQGRIFMY